jgi:colanic acid/amylovoran biosynthesis glycosyltransferase
MCDDPSGNRQVISLVKCFGRRSETWLYNQLKASVRYRVHVLTDVHINKDEYPFHQVTQVSAPLTSRLRKKLGQGTRRQSRNWIAEGKRQIRRILVKSPPAVLQAHFGWTGFHALEFLTGSSCSGLVWLYGSDVFRSGPCREYWLPELFKSDLYFGCTSRALKDEAVLLGCRPKRIRVVYPGIDAGSIEPRHAPGHHEEIRIVSVGRLVDFKDPVGLARVAGILKRRGLRFRWDVLGGGPLFPEMQWAVAKEGVDEWMHLRGEVPHGEVLQNLQQADLMVHNGVIGKDGGRESFGVVLVEAGAAGLPIVATSVGGVPEIVIDKETGLLTPAGDTEAMAGAVLTLACDPDLRWELGAAARGRVIEAFAMERLGRDLDELYEDLSKQSA